MNGRRWQHRTHVFYLFRITVWQPAEAAQLTASAAQWQGMANRRSVNIKRRLRRSGKSCDAAVARVAYRNGEWRMNIAHQYVVISVRRR